MHVAGLKQFLESPPEKGLITKEHIVMHTHLKLS